ncbi:MAG TPA: Fe-S-binding domain-containing protein, partial [Candidatus Didemnitutus sp.]|nr:Fe-S-binding domain-containing protein [Candidatus Didemnitutus sp.]
MKPLLIVAVPLVGAALAAIWRSDRTRPWLLPVVGLVHATLCFWLLLDPPAVAPGAWLAFDPLARAVLPAVSLLFLVCAAYGVPYLRLRQERPNRIFVVAMLAVLGLLSAGHQARHLGVLWIATEAVTL